jgi:hypothetical protein
MPRALDHNALRELKTSFPAIQNAAIRMMGQSPKMTGRTVRPLNVSMEYAEKIVNPNDPITCPNTRPLLSLMLRYPTLYRPAAASIG